MTVTRSKVKVKVTGPLNFRQLAKPCMLAAMTAAPLRGFLVKSVDYWTVHKCNENIQNPFQNLTNSSSDP